MEDDTLLRSYQDYMLAGTTTTTNTASTSTSTSRKEMGTNTNTNSTATKRFHTLLTTFASSVANEWMYYDDQLSTLVSSIDNLRQRLPLIHRQWVQQKKKQRQGGQQGLPPWTQYNSTSKGSTPSTCSYFLSSSSLTLQLTEEDLFRTLHHELQNHEKYMAYVRKLLLQMSDVVQTASRQLDAAFLFYQQHRDTLAIPNHYYTASFLLDLACDVFTIISKQLYRRQTLAQTKLFNTDMDSLLPEDDPYDNTTSGTSLSHTLSSASSTSLLMSQNDEIRAIDDTMRLNLFLDHLTPKNIEKQS
jgi:hypothetical protein